MKQGTGKRTGYDRQRSCEWVRSRLSLLLGRDLHEVEDRRIRDHLLSCMECRKELGIWLSNRKLLARMAPDVSGALDASGAAFFQGLYEDILARVRKPEVAFGPVTTPPGSSRWSRVGVRTRVAGVAAAAALFLVGLMIGMGGDRPASGFLGRPAISDSVQSFVDPASSTMPVGYFGGLESLSRTVRATLEHAAAEDGEMSDADKAEFAKRFQRLWLRRTLECGEVDPSADLAAELGDEECRQLLRRFRRECRRRGR